MRCQRVSIASAKEADGVSTPGMKERFLTNTVRNPQDTRHEWQPGNSLCLCWGLCFLWICQLDVCCNLWGWLALVQDLFVKKQIDKWIYIYIFIYRYTHIYIITYIQIYSYNVAAKTWIAKYAGLGSAPDHRKGNAAHQRTRRGDGGRWDFRSLCIYLYLYFDIIICIHIYINTHTYIYKYNLQISKCIRPNWRVSMWRVSGTAPVQNFILPLEGAIYAVPKGIHSFC